MLLSVVAFLVAYDQNKQLIGEKGLLPCKQYLKSVKRYVGGKIDMKALSYTPTVLWFLDWSDMDANLDCIALLGLGLSAFVLLTGCANMIIMSLLWILYHSLVSVGQIWCPKILFQTPTWDLVIYHFHVLCFSGWESQLLETGFLGIFLCPLWSLRTVPRNTPPSRIVIWAFRWLIFRIMLGAGLIKLRGDRCWRDLTCMDYHYETQPVPNPMAYYMHRSPWWFHSFETLFNHVIELIVPFFIFMGRRMCAVNGLLQILFQVVLIVSGNLSFLNWLTIVPSIACFDDASLGFLFRSGQGGVKHQVEKVQSEGKPATTWGMQIRRVANISVGLLIVCLSMPVVLNLVSSQQIMNTSFNPLRIVNTYGAFGRSAMMSALNCVIQSLNLETYEQNEWVIHLAGKLLANDTLTLSLMAHNPFEGREPPRWVRGEHFRYKFSAPGGNHAAEGKWWIRRRIGPYFPPVNSSGLRKYFEARDWPHPDSE
ncbi:hypothetical protein EOD39_6973 [Acipenser ruthenus]|uniref:Lipase maturation factor n=1 Tax=Acipenser ruthenus TaxID=7906 RepID=A0A444U8D4_ACIRT|nr:hypothetical protein EOD39_6973 [Acipenser ruthenus]